MSRAPAAVYDVDLYSDDVLADPYPHYRALRDLGPAVYCPANDLWAISRYDDVRDSLRDHRTFSSAAGVAANAAMNEASRGTTIASDPPEHDVLRSVIAAPLGIRAVRELEGAIQAEADRLVEGLVARESFDAVHDLARHLPVQIVSELVGLPEEGRQNMLRWAAATFDALGADNDRAKAARPALQEMRHYTLNEAVPGRLKPGSWAARLYEAGDNGIVPRDRCPIMMRDYLGPSLDTTIFAIGNLVWLFGRHPDQWDLLRADHGLIPGAINESIRLESPIRGFTRLVTGDHAIGDVVLPAGSRALVLYASANRDERKWSEPERFDIRRRASDHLGFGNGVHACAGSHLARLEITAILTALLPRVSRFEIGAPVQAFNNLLRGLERLPVTVHRAI